MTIQSFFYSRCVRQLGPGIKHYLRTHERKLIADKPFTTPCLFAENQQNFPQNCANLNESVIFTRLARTAHGLPFSIQSQAMRFNHCQARQSQYMIV